MIKRSEPPRQQRPYSPGSVATGRPYRDHRQPEKQATQRSSSRRVLFEDDQVEVTYDDEMRTSKWDQKGYDPYQSTDTPKERRKDRPPPSDEHYRRDDYSPPPSNRKIPEKMTFEEERKLQRSTYQTQPQGWQGSRDRREYSPEPRLSGREDKSSYKGSRDDSVRGDGDRYRDEPGRDDSRRESSYDDQRRNDPDDRYGEYQQPQRARRSRDAHSQGSDETEKARPSRKKSERADDRQDEWQPGGRETYKRQDDPPWPPYSTKQRALNEEIYPTDSVYDPRESRRGGTYPSTNPDNLREDPHRPVSPETKKKTSGSYGPRVEGSYSRYGSSGRDTREKYPSDEPKGLARNYEDREWSGRSGKRGESPKRREQGDRDYDHKYPTDSTQDRQRVQPSDEPTNRSGVPSNRGSDEQGGRRIELTSLTRNRPSSGWTANLAERGGPQRQKKRNSDDRREEDTNASSDRTLRASRPEENGKRGSKAIGDSDRVDQEYEKPPTRDRDRYTDRENARLDAEADSERIESQRKKDRTDWRTRALANVKSDCNDLYTDLQTSLDTEILGSKGRKGWGVLYYWNPRQGESHFRKQRKKFVNEVRKQAEEMVEATYSRHSKSTSATLPSSKAISIVGNVTSTVDGRSGVSVKPTATIKIGDWPKTVDGDSNAVFFHKQSFFERLS